MPAAGTIERMSQRLRRLAPGFGLIGAAVVAGGVLWAVGGKGTVPAAPGMAPRLVVVALGTAQDGGVPQVGCDCSRCVAARHDPNRRRRVASLALRLPGSGHTWLIDATPDLGEQLEVVHRWRSHPAAAPDRHPVDGVLLTHAHIGHYLGLAFFGYESINSSDLPVYASPRMAAFLRGNGPWGLLVERRNVVLHELAPGAPLALEPGLTVTPLVVPHRGELSDTLGFVVRGPRRSLLYVPDTDSWAAWERPLPEVLRRERVDVALLDGTFYSPGELPDRDLRKIGHPLMTATMELLREQVRGGMQVYFTHLNHSNPALDPAGPEHRALAAAGFRVLEEGQELEL
jgi:pyrroloquinoline quinone biosynthesis protein B